MCCFFLLLAFFGPRTALVFWWIVGRTSWDNAWGDVTVLFKGIMFIFAPWTALMFLLLGGEPINGWDWLFIGIAILADIASWANIIWRRGRDVPPQYAGYVPADLR